MVKRSVPRLIASYVGNTHVDYLTHRARQLILLTGAVCKNPVFLEKETIPQGKLESIVPQFRLPKGGLWGARGSYCM